jgi:hypothetical protein
LNSILIPEQDPFSPGNVSVLKNYLTHDGDDYEKENFNSFKQGYKGQSNKRLKDQYSPGMRNSNENIRSKYQEDIINSHLHSSK